MVKWAIELGELDVSYQPRIAIKGQILVDFLGELTPIEMDNRSSSKLEWTLHVDRSSIASSNGALHPRGWRLSM